MSEPAPRNWIHILADQVDPYLREMSRREYWGVGGIALMGIGFGWIWFPLALIFIGLAICAMVATSFYGQVRSTSRTEED